MKNYDDPHLKQSEEDHDLKDDFLRGLMRLHREVMELDARHHRINTRYFRIIIGMNLVIYIATNANYWLASPERQLYNGIYWLTLTIMFSTSLLFVELVKLRQRSERWELKQTLKERKK